MTYLALIERLSDKTKYTKREMRNILRHIYRIIDVEICNGRDVEWSGFGSFRNMPVPAHWGRHPRTQMKMIVPATRKIRFVPGGEFKKRIHASIRHFRNPDLLKKYIRDKEDYSDG